ncbi:hydroxymethylglutaryl-CoA synthase [Microbacterium sp. 18062]|uniref:hydroxymethylglutaryl-CoA synthase n=1 Tax=Microbacterium sp. 18062 TaxID=2681410 RepID=UPI001358E464|nr:hydroxymethylglutaryl-CoA synthase [Microbacterium sp. 18062]
MTTPIGIHDLSLATTGYVLDLADLAAATGVDPDKYRIGLGQDEMSVPGPDEDIVTMGAAAALPILERHGRDRIRTLFFATESGVDQSKSAAVFAHRLLELPAACRAVELKQACYAATAALQAGIGIVARNPGEQVLVIASDIARYEVDTAAEPTQGAGAVAFLVSADPALVEIEPVVGVDTADVDDFWRPNDSVTAVVDGKLSIDAYLDGFTAAWDDYRARGGADIDAIGRFCHHQPFTRMAAKAHRRLAEHTGVDLPADRYETSTAYNRRMGNSYTASLYAGLAALLDGDDNLAGRRIGFLSYGSGSVSEFFTGVVGPDYREHRRGAQAQLDAREPVSVARYRELHAAAHLGSTHDVEIAPETRTRFHFAGIRGRARRYRS